LSPKYTDNENAGVIDPKVDRVAFENASAISGPDVVDGGKPQRRFLDARKLQLEAISVASRGHRS